MTKQSFDQWHKNHGCSTKELWLIQNCLGTLYGFDHPDAKAASESWGNSRKANQGGLKEALTKIREANPDTTTPCPTCGMTENGMTVEEEEELRRRSEEEGFVPMDEVFKDDEAEWRTEVIDLMEHFHVEMSGMPYSIVKSKLEKIRKKFL